uniref:Bm14229 n=1 Tax=Brugia malayi TaxID=6279 RepID=A0A1I9G330_BRUMA|nr:Bm14229 [Brugia malayi]
MRKVRARYNQLIVSIISEVSLLISLIHQHNQYWNYKHSELVSVM